MNKVLTLFLTVAVIAAVGYLFWTTSGSFTPVQVQEVATTTQQVISARADSLREETATYTIDAEYPQFGIAVIDEQIKRTVLEAVEDFKKNAVESPPSPLGVKYELTSIFDPPHISDDIVSVRLVISTYMGGAHPMAYASGLNFDRMTGKILSLSDALSFINLPLSDVAAESLRQMRSRHGGSLFEDGLVATPENYNTFIVDDTIVTFTFQLYQIAAYAAGFQEVSFPRKK